MRTGSQARDRQPARGLSLNQISAANQRALDELSARIRDRLLQAQEAGETGDLEIMARMALHKGNTQSIRWRPDERIVLA